MSDSDSFIREVTEEVQRDRLYGLWKKYAPAAIGGLVAIVLAAAGLQFWDHRREAQARDAGGRVLDALDAGDAEARAAALLTARDSLDDGPARLARLAAAAALAEAGETAEAARLYESLAADSAVSEAVAGFAAYRAAVLSATAPDAVAAALTPLIDSGGPYRLLALEARGAARAQSGESDGARADFETILADPEATEGLRQRAVEAVNALGLEG